MLQVTFKNGFSYTTYRPAEGLGDHLVTPAGLVKPQGLVQFAEAQIYQLVGGSSVVAAKVIGSHDRDLLGKLIDIDQWHLRMQFPDAPDKPGPKLIF